MEDRNQYLYPQGGNMKEDESIFKHKCGRCGDMKAGESGICLECVAKLHKNTPMRSFLTPEEQIQRRNLCSPRIQLARPNDPNNKIQFAK